MKLVEAVIAKLKNKLNEEGNGIVINHKNGKRYEVWASEDGTYLITDKISHWDKETYCKRFASVKELAIDIIDLKG